MLESGLPEIVGGDEDLARFLTSSSHFNTGGVKAPAFLPSPNDRETSVFRHGGEPQEALWAIADQHLAVRRIYGAAIVKVQHVRDCQLDVIASEPPLRHAAMRSWPWLDDPELQKAQQKERAAQIASKSSLVLRPLPTNGAP
jgi:hypothetical protein